MKAFSVPGDLTSYAVITMMLFLLKIWLCLLSCQIRSYIYLGIYRSQTKSTPTEPPSGSTTKFTHTSLVFLRANDLEFRSYRVMSELSLKLVWSDALPSDPMQFSHAVKYMHTFYSHSERLARNPWRRFTYIP